MRNTRGHLVHFSWYRSHASVCWSTKFLCMTLGTESHPRPWRSTVQQILAPAPDGRWLDAPSIRRSRLDNYFRATVLHTAKVTFKLTTCSRAQEEGVREGG